MCLLPVAWVFSKYPFSNQQLPYLEHWFLAFAKRKERTSHSDICLGFLPKEDVITGNRFFLCFSFLTYTLHVLPYYIGLDRNSKEFFYIFPKPVLYYSAAL